MNPVHLSKDQLGALLLAVHQDQDHELERLLSQLTPAELEALVEDASVLASWARGRLHPVDPPLRLVPRRTPAPVNDLVSVSGHYRCDP